MTRPGLRSGALLLYGGRGFSLGRGNEEEPTLWRRLRHHDERALPAYSGETVWALHPASLTARVLVDCAVSISANGFVFVVPFDCAKVKAFCSAEQSPLQLAESVG